MPKIIAPGVTASLLRQYGLHPRKNFGQNFLTDEVVLERIVAAAGVETGDLVLEVGPGLGTVTQALAERAGKVVAVEIDRDLVAALSVILSPCSNVTVVEGDILAVDLAALLQEADPEGRWQRKMVGNLPYYITTPIIFRLIESNLGFRVLVVMVQKEVAERITAAPGGKEYGALSVAVQYRAVPEVVTVVPRTAFMPSPQVDSAVLRLTVRERPPVEVNDEATFFRVVRAAFGHRRKTISNALVHSDLGLAKEEVQRRLEQAGIEPQRRGETLSLVEFAGLANLLSPLTEPGNKTGRE